MGFPVDIRFFSHSLARLPLSRRCKSDGLRAAAEVEKPEY